MSEEKEKKKRSHSKYTRQLMKLRRSQRQRQPREGSSNRRQSFYEELKHQYRKNPEMLAWIEKNKKKLGTTKESATALGVVTEYHDTYTYFHFIPVGTLFFDPNENEEFIEEELPLGFNYDDFATEDVFEELDS